MGKKKNCSKSIHNEVPHHGYLPLKEKRKEKTKPNKKLLQGFLMTENKALDHKNKVGKWYQKTV